VAHCRPGRAARHVCNWRKQTQHPQPNPLVNQPRCAIQCHRGTGTSLAPLRPPQRPPPIFPAKPQTAAVAASDVIGPQAHRQDTATVGVPIVGDPVVSHKQKGIIREWLRIARRTLNKVASYVFQSSVQAKGCP
jgi:hypothetical protein